MRFRVKWTFQCLVFRVLSNRCIVRPHIKCIISDSNYIIITVLINIWKHWTENSNKQHLANVSNRYNVRKQVDRFIRFFCKKRRERKPIKEKKQQTNCVNRRSRATSWETIGTQIISYTWIEKKKVRDDYMWNHLFYFKVATDYLHIL